MAGGDTGTSEIVMRRLDKGKTTRIDEVGFDRSEDAFHSLCSGFSHAHEDDVERPIAKHT
jgi:hypothetical protein